ncbi:ankyrin repeat domain-containing protein [Myxococcaceae bacterium JPH2]|nr:ankyrin repeat domain-containing protein [Myxococcaceae bacterium JPH2]
MTSSPATQALFKAIHNYSRLAEFRNAEHEDAAAMQALREALAQGADWKALLGPGGRDAAFTAATCADGAPLAALLDHGVPLNHEAGGDGQLIHRAASFGRLGVIQMLVARGVPADVRDGGNRTPLDHARAWRHGANAVSGLIELMQAQGCKPQPARRTDDLLADPVRALLPELAAELSPATRTTLERAVAAFFTEYAGGKAKDFLLELAEHQDGAMLAAGIRIVQRASTAKVQPKTTRTKRLTLAHIGDLEVEGDCNAVNLIVTGNLTVKGLLSNYEGALVCVGGDLKVESAWSEGPLWVGGDLRADTVFAGADNDYGATVRGTLEAPTILQFDHVIQAGTLRVERHFRERGAVPSELTGTLAAALKMKKW